MLDRIYRMNRIFFLVPFLPVRKRGKKFNRAFAEIVRSDF